MPRYVWDPEKRKFVEPHEYRPKQSAARSDLPMPYVIGPLKEYRSMATGEMITDRRQHREHLKQHGLVEVGNEPIETGPRKSDPGPAARDVKDAIDRLKAGDRPPPVEHVDLADTRLYDN